MLLWHKEKYTPSRSRTTSAPREKGHRRARGSVPPGGGEREHAPTTASEGGDRRGEPRPMRLPAGGGAAGPTACGSQSALYTQKAGRRSLGGSPLLGSISSVCGPLTAGPGPPFRVPDEHALHFFHGRPCFLGACDTLSGATGARSSRDGRRFDLPRARPTPRVGRGELAHGSIAVAGPVRHPASPARTALRGALRHQDRQRAHRPDGLCKA